MTRPALGMTKQRILQLACRHSMGRGVDATKLYGPFVASDVPYRGSIRAWLDDLSSAEAIRRAPR
jgi:hypothetical protein